MSGGVTGIPAFQDECLGGSITTSNGQNHPVSVTAQSNMPRVLTLRNGERWKVLPLTTNHELPLHLLDMGHCAFISTKIRKTMEKMQTVLAAHQPLEGAAIWKDWNDWWGFLLHIAVLFYSPWTDRNNPCKNPLEGPALWGCNVLLQHSILYGTSSCPALTNFCHPLERYESSSWLPALARPGTATVAIWGISQGMDYLRLSHSELCISST